MIKLAQTLSFSVTGLPSRTTGSFNPASVTGGGTSTLTVKPARNATRGTYTLTIKGEKGAISG